MIGATWRLKSCQMIGLYGRDGANNRERVVNWREVN